MSYTVKVVIATHKKYQMPTDKLYLPIHVGADDKKDIEGNDIDLGYAKDNTGVNISKLNSSFCELTGLYWAWKNLYEDYIGLVHYRRHFSLIKKQDFNNILKYEELSPYLGEIKIFVPYKRKYYIETLYSHYKHTHYAEQLDETRKIIVEKYPDYLSNYDTVIKHTYGHMFNMMIMEKKLFGEYCTWLFNILFELYKRISTNQLNAFQGRYPGRVSEIIFNVWLSKMIEDGKIKKSEIMELPYIYMEKVDWKAKGSAFLRAKFINQKYKKSF